MNLNVRHLSMVASTVLITVLLGACSKPPSALTSAAPAASATAAEVSDIDITEHVKTALLQTPSLNGMTIAVVTLKGDVRLTGVLDSQAQIDEALRVARAAEGMHAIHDELTVRK